MATKKKAELTNKDAVLTAAEKNPDAKPAELAEIVEKQYGNAVDNKQVSQILFQARKNGSTAKRKTSAKKTTAKKTAKKSTPSIEVTLADIEVVADIAAQLGGVDVVIAVCEKMKELEEKLSQ